MTPDDKNNGNQQQPGQPTPPGLPPVTNQIIINLHVGGRVTGNMPTDMKLTMYMIGEFFKSIGPLLKFEQPSPIVTPPKGILIPRG